MNYIKLINAFERWCECNHLPSSSQLLWYKLAKLCNRCGWTEWLQVDSLTLMANIQVSRKATFADIRNRLIISGLIRYKAGSKGTPGKYHMVNLYDTNSSTGE